ncbi:hypothetical protein BJV74DRAFT_865669 [Russula compacta]|nr:hypothetical protein BJV74DRAFT_865669 [Russula compacta]
MPSDSDDDYFDEPDELDPNAFHIWDPLRKPVTLQYTTEQLHQMIHEGDIDLDPEYQRAVVWSSTKQMAIIDSLFHNYYIPPVVFAIVNDPIDGVETRLCVDGKQRLTSIQKFFDGQIAYRCPRTKKTWWYTTSTSTRASRAEIPAYEKRIFAQKLITCIEYRNLSPTAEREVFQRVQLGVSLTAAEKLQAISSPWANYITHLEKTHVTIDGGLVDHIAFDDTRGRAFQNTAQLVYCCAGLPAEQRIPTAAKLEKWLTTPDERPSAAFQDAMAAVLARLWELAGSEELDAPFRRIQAKVAPVEFVYIGVLLYTMRHGYTIAEQSRAMFVLRRDIRKAHVDVRFNSRVAVDCWRLIDAIENGEVALELPPSTTGTTTSTSTPARANGKRKSLNSQSQPSPARSAAARGKKKRVG